MDFLFSLFVILTPISALNYHCQRKYKKEEEGLRLQKELQVQEELAREKLLSEYVIKYTTAGSSEARLLKFSRKEIEKGLKPVELVTRLLTDNAPLQNFPIIRYRQEKENNFGFLQLEKDTILKTPSEELTLFLDVEGAVLSWTQEEIESYRVKKMKRDETKPEPIVLNKDKKPVFFHEDDEIKSIKLCKDKIWLNLTSDNWHMTCHNIILYGSPGTGKNLFVRNLFDSLQEAAADLDKVEVLFNAPCSTLLDKFLGNSEKHVSDWCSIAAKNPGKLFLICLDEIDVIAGRHKNSDASQSTREDVSRSILSVLLELTQHHRNVMVVGITNFIDSLDAAFTRNERFNQKVLFPVCSFRNRMSFLQKMKHSDVVFPSQLHKVLAAFMTSGFTQAEMKTITKSNGTILTFDELVSHIQDTCETNRTRQPWIDMIQGFLTFRPHVEGETLKYYQDISSRINQGDRCITLVEHVNDAEVKSSKIKPKRFSVKIEIGKIVAWLFASITEHSKVGIQFDAIFIIDRYFYCIEQNQSEQITLIVEQCKKFNNVLVIIQWNAFYIAGNLRLSHLLKFFLDEVEPLNNTIVLMFGESPLLTNKSSSTG